MQLALQQIWTFGVFWASHSQVQAQHFQQHNSDTPMGFPEVECIPQSGPIYSFWH